jgi:glutamate-5-semialdehyde dehydrogenase
VRVPIGVIAIIYESRPNVTVDAAALCLKSGNAVILRGGSDAIHSNRALAAVLAEAARAAGLPEGCVSLVADTSREAASELMRLNGLVDVLIPRGGKGLIRSVVQNATVPVIQTGEGVCHVYVDRDADPAMGRKIAVSAKVSRPSVCNSAETLLVDAAIADGFLPGCLNELRDAGVEIRGCARTKAIAPWVMDAAAEDWDAEYNDLIYAVRVVEDADEAIRHINRHGTRHSEAIITENAATAQKFFDLVDAACVYWNASTRFTDGGEFGFGAEIGISNQKLHARGPMGLKELTTVKYEITGNGQTR